MENKTQKVAFSKALLIQESILVWIITIASIVLAFICAIGGYLGTLPWLVTMITTVWAAYGVSQAFYYKKSQAENSQGGITYDMAMKQLGIGAPANPTDYQI